MARGARSARLPWMYSRWRDGSRIRGGRRRYHLRLGYGPPSSAVAAVDAPLTYRGRLITDADVGFIRALIARHLTASRCALSTHLAETCNWRQANGVLRAMVVRGPMLAPHRHGAITLAPPRATPTTRSSTVLNRFLRRASGCVAHGATAYVTGRLLTP